MGSFFAAEEFRAALSAAGIRDYAGAMSFRGGTLLNAHRGRSVVRLAGSLFLKRFIGSPRAAAAERRAMERLAAGPGPAPAPLAAWGAGAEGAFLVTARPPGAVPLAEALDVLAGRARHDFVRTLGERIRDLHGRGLTCPDLSGAHLLVRPPDGVFLIDPGRLGRRPLAGARVRDLAALELSLPFGAAAGADRVRFARAYLGDRGGVRRLLGRVERAFRRLDRRSRHRTDRFVADPAYAGLLARHGLGSCEAMLARVAPGAVRLRALPDRENWRLTLDGREFFLKRHAPRRGLARTPAAEEWEAARVFRRNGLPAMRPAAFAEDVRRGSAILVERSPGEPLDDLLRGGGASPVVRRELVAEAAAIARRMRKAEIHHRDFYCCHLIADAAAPAGRRITLIDLQRARRRPGLLARWYVKDVAELLHSAPRPPVTGADIARFLRMYFGVQKIGVREKSFARQVAAKAARIAARQRRKGGGARA